LNTNGTTADPPASGQNKRPPRQPADQAQRLRGKEALRHKAKQKKKRKNKKGDAQPQRLAWPINEGAHRMGVGRTSVYKLAAEGKLRLIKIAGRTLIPDSEVVRVAAEGA
jgi:excisionase family DNA binding protein